MPIAKLPARRGRPKRKELAKRNALIVAVARETFTECGYAAASLENIARRAGVAKQTLYSTYGGKSGLFACVVKDSAAGFARRSSVAEGTTAAETLEKCAISMVMGAEARERLGFFRMILASTPTDHAIAHPVRVQGRAETIRHVKAVFDTLYQRGLLNYTSSEMAELFVDMVIGATVLNVLTGLETSPRAAIRRRVAHFLSASPSVKAAR